MITDVVKFLNGILYYKIQGNIKNDNIKKYTKPNDIWQQGAVMKDI